MAGPRFRFVYAKKKASFEKEVNILLDLHYRIIRGNVDANGFYAFMLRDAEPAPTEAS